MRVKDRLTDWIAIKKEERRTNDGLKHAIMQGDWRVGAHHVKVSGLNKRENKRANHKQGKDADSSVGGGCLPPIISKDLGGIGHGSQVVIRPATVLFRIRPKG